MMRCIVEPALTVMRPLRALKLLLAPKPLLLSAATSLAAFALAPTAFAADKPDCSRPLTLALHDHGLLYSAQTGEGIDKDIADELIRRSGCRISVSLMPRARAFGS